MDTQANGFVDQDPLGSHASYKTSDVMVRSLFNPLKKETSDLHDFQLDCCFSQHLSYRLTESFKKVA